MICFRGVLIAPPSRTGAPTRSPVRHTPGSRTDDRHPRASAAYRRASRARDRGHPAGPRRRPRRHPGPGRPVRGAQPHLRARLAGLPRRSCSVLGGLDDLRPVRGRHVHRAVRLLAGPRPGALGVAVQVDHDVRAPTGLAHPAALLGRARIQPGDDLVCARPGLLGPHVPLMNSALVKFTPDLAVLFAVGLLSAAIVTAGERTRSRPWAGYALAATVPVIALMVVKGSTWSNLNLFWLDLAWAPALGCFLAAIATSRPRLVIRFLDGRLPRSLGACSYSLYLPHMPIVIAVSYGLVLGRVATGTPTFFVLAAILLPITVCFARLFAAVFELPFQRHRGWIALQQAMSARLWQLRRTEPGVVAGHSRGASRTSGPRSQAGGRCRPAHRRLVADRARPASRPGPLVPPGPGDCATRSGSC